MTKDEARASQMLDRAAAYLAKTGTPAQLRPPYPLTTAIWLLQSKAYALRHDKEEQLSYAEEAQGVE